MFIQEQIGVVDLILNCLTEYEYRVSHLIEKLENMIITEVNPEELEEYGVISIHDKRDLSYAIRIVVGRYTQKIEVRVGCGGGGV